MPEPDPHTSILVNLHTGVVVHGPDSSVLFCNIRAAQLLGLSQAQMLGKRAVDPGWHFIGEDGVRMDVGSYPVSRVMGTGRALDETVLGVVAPGRTQVVWLQVTAFPEHDARGVLQRVVVNFHDISALKQVQEHARLQERIYRALFETIPHGVVYHDAQGAITAANPAAQRMLASPQLPLHGRTFRDPFWTFIQEDGTLFPADQHPVTQALRTRLPVIGVVMGLAHGDAGATWLEVSAMPLAVEDPASEVYAIFEDITERKKLARQVDQLAFFDPLTKLANRRLLDDRMRQAMTATRRSAAFGAVLVLDLDNFKSLNDAHGHSAGDLLLVEVAARLTNTVREVDTIARFGGDEFVIVARELNSERSVATKLALAIAEKVRVVLSLPYVLLLENSGQSQRVEHHCSASIGVALFDHANADAGEIFKRADHAMYQAKHEGRNLTRLFASWPGTRAAHSAGCATPD